MSTIDQLAPATSASDGDEFPISQGGITRKITRAQVLNGVQPQLAVPAGALLGRTSAGMGSPQAITVGQNLSLNGGTLSATASPFVINSLPAGTVPGSGDLIPASQAGKAVAITYAQLLGGISSDLNLNISQTLVTPNGATNSQTLGQLTGNMLSRSGGTLTGNLMLAGGPVAPAQAANKAYVDQQVSTALALSGGSMAGILSLSALPRNQMDAVTKSYADGLISGMLPNTGGSLSGSLLLSSDPTNSVQASTKHYTDTKLARTGDTLSGMLSLAADPIVPSHAATKNYVDLQISLSLPKAGGTLSGSLFLAADPTINAQAATKQYVDRRVSRAGDTLTGALVLAADPILPPQAATKNYVDVAVSSSIARSGSSMTGALLLTSDPASPLQAATKQYVDLHVMRNGDSLTGALVLYGDPTSPAQAATKRYVDSVLSSAITRAGGTFTGPIVLAGDPAQATQAATKQYVDRQTAIGLPLSGGSLTGALTLAAGPTVALHSATKQYVDSQVAASLSRSGGTLSGSLMLAGTPTAPLQAATKSYVDANPNSQGVINVKLPPYSAKLDGVTDDTAAFSAAYQAATAGSAIYVPNGKTVLQQPGTWGVALTKRVKWIVDGTVLADGTPLGAGIPTGGAPVQFVLPGLVVGNTPLGLTTSQGASQATDFAVSQSSYIVNHSGGQNGAVVANVRADTIIYSSPGNYVWGGLDRLVWAGSATPSSAAPAQHVSRYIQTLRQSASASSGGTLLPQPQLWAACIEYRDTTGQPSSATAASLTAEMDWFGNGPDDGNNRAIQSLVVGQHNLKGPAVEVANIIGVYLSNGSAGSAKTVFGIGVPFSNAVLDTTYAEQINNAPVIKMSAGQAIAFESTNTNRLAYDSTTNTLRWNQGTLSYPIGKGLSVGAGKVYSASAALPNYISGNFIFLTGGSPYNITLPPASTVAAGTGYTFSVGGSAPASILTSGSDGIDSNPVVLHTNDRYHVVSDGVSFWHEVFWTNAVSPRFSGPVVLPSFAVVSLPIGVQAGAKAFASNGRKPSDGAGFGTGVEVFFDGQHWISSCGGTPVVA